MRSFLAAIVVATVLAIGFAVVLGSFQKPAEAEHGGPVWPRAAGAAVAASVAWWPGQNLTSCFGRGRGNGTAARSATVLCMDGIIG